ncbi:MAG: AI-2E family transporter, partial [Oceanisphaera sp.]|nr:AI-2E family transporter [Oceanisphaera sp.]
MSESQKGFLLAGLGLGGLLLYLLAPVLTPFLVAAVLAYIGDPLVDRLEAWGLSRTLSVVSVFVTLTL